MEIQKEEAKYYAEKAERRKRRWRDPNYVMTPEDRVDDVVEVVFIGSAVALVAYAVFRWIRGSGQD